MSTRPLAASVCTALRAASAAALAHSSLCAPPASPIVSCPRRLHVTPAWQGSGKRTRAKSVSDFHRGVRGGRRGDTALDMGLVGERSWEWGFVGRFDEQMPDLETLRAEYGGTKYKDLPICHIKASRNNTILLFTDAKGDIITATSCRAEGFKNARKKTTVAGQATGVAAGLRAMRRGVTHVRVKVRGLGPGRVSSVHGLSLSGLHVVSITDFTHVMEVGPRPKKQRRL